MTPAAPVVGALPPFVGVLLYVLVAGLVLRTAVRWAREASGDPPGRS